jgi:hypothetical protein
VSTSTTTVRTCDECDEEIAGRASYVSAYGLQADFHPECWEKIGGPRVARLLALDTVQHVTVSENGYAARQGPAWSAP